MSRKKTANVFAEIYFFQASCDTVILIARCYISFQSGKNGCAVRAERFEQTPRPLLLWSGAAKRCAECAALRVGPKRPSPR